MIIFTIHKITEPIFCEPNCMSQLRQWHMIMQKPTKLALTRYFVSGSERTKIVWFWNNLKKIVDDFSNINTYVAVSSCNHNTSAKFGEKHSNSYMSASIRKSSLLFTIKESPDCFIVCLDYLHFIKNV